MLLFAVLPCCARSLRVCADPNNLPFSNNHSQGFENKIAELLARGLHARLQYTWWSERKSFVRNSLLAGACDVVLGIPAGFPSILTTAPYYRSSYVLITRRDRGYHLASLDDPRLARLRIGIHVVGDDYAPPAQALARRGIVNNIVGFSLFGAYGESNPAARIIHAVAHGDVDVAIVWGPLAGYFARQQPEPLDIVPVAGFAAPLTPLAYDISMGVRPGDAALKADLERVLQQERGAICRILARYGVPLVQTGKEDAACGSVSVSAASASR